MPAIPGFGVRPSRLPTWIADEGRRHDWRSLVEAGHSIGTYHANRWIDQVDVPTAVVCTTRDRGVRPELQLALAESIPGATVHRIDDGHLACARPEFGRVLDEAVVSVADRIASAERVSGNGRSAALD